MAHIEHALGEDIPIFLFRAGLRAALYPEETAHEEILGCHHPCGDSPAGIHQHADLGRYAPLMRSLAAERCVAISGILSALMLSTVLPNPRIRYWPDTLTKELIEDIYRPQIDRLREIATHFDRYVAAYEQRAATQAPNTRWTPISIDIELFSIPSVFSASVATRAPDEWALVGGFYCGLPAEATRIVAKSYFSPRKWPIYETALRAGWVKLSDYSCKNAVIYSGALIDDRGERRAFELCLHLKAVISQIPKPSTSQR